MTSARVKELRDIVRGIATEICNSDVTFGSGLFPALKHCEQQAAELADSLHALAKGLDRWEARQRPTFPDQPPVDNCTCGMKFGPHAANCATRRKGSK
jgi:hypothetical protein